MYEVRRKQRHWKSVKHGEKFLGKHLIPVIKGLKDRLYLIDHHHLGRCLYEEKIKVIGVTVVADLSHLSDEEFWYVMDHRDWVHPYAFGKRYDYSDLPKSIDKLEDDPFRSLAGELRRAGGFSKETAPFSEFLWANHLRHRMDNKMVAKDFEWALEKALLLAKETEASYLPGWCGPVPEE